MNIKSRVVAVVTTVALSGVAAVVPLVAVADHTTAHTIETLTAQIAALQAQLLALSAGSAAPVAGKCSFTRSLTVGARGDDVTCLQNYLTGTGHFTFAGGATGYFGGVTRSAVAAWQSANSVSPAVGYFGPLSRAKYDSLVAGAPAAPAPVVPGAPVVTVAVGSGLTVTAAADQPAANLAPLKAARVPFVKAVFTASADGDVTVKSVTVERQGLADDDAFDSIILLDQDGVQIGDSKNLNSLHQVKLNEPFVVKAGTSKTIAVGANMVSTSGSNAGQVAKFAIVAVDAGASAVNASFPIVGNGMTVNETLSIGSIDSPTRGTRDPGAGRDPLEIGTKGFIASGVKWTVGSAEPVFLEQLRWYQSGSIAAGDIKNVKVVLKDVEYDAVVSSDGKYYTTKFGSGIEFDKGANIDIYVKADIESGSNRTLDFDIQKRTDLVARGKTFNYYMVVANGTSDPTDDTGAFSNTEPYYDAYQHSISKGSLRAEKSNVVAAGNVPEDVSGTPLGAFTFEAKGEPVQISSMKISFTRTGTVDGDDITNVSLYDANGAVVAGPKDTASGEFTYTDSWTVPIGTHVYTLKGKIGSNAANNDTIQASTTPSTYTAKGEVTGLTISPTPATAVTANSQTVKAAVLTVALGTSPVAQNVVRGINGFNFTKVNFDATASGEDLRVTAQVLGLTPAGGAQANDINSCQMFDGATALNTGGNAVSPTGTTANTEVALTFNFDTGLTVPKGTVKVVDVKCNISNTPAAGETLRIGLTSTNQNTTVSGLNTGTSVTETVTANTGPTMTIQTAGTLVVVADSSSPSVRFGVAGKTNQVVSVLKLTSTNEAIKLQQIGLVLSTSTASTSDLALVTLWDGATQVGVVNFTEVTPAAGGPIVRATSTLSSDFIIPKDGAKLLTVKADLSFIGTSEAGTRGRLIEINYDGAAGVSGGSTEGIGQSSGTTINPSAGGDTAAAGVRLVRTVPTFTKIAPLTSTLSNTAITLYRFSITADASKDLQLSKVTLRLATSGSVTADKWTVNTINLYAFTDTGFGTQAYANNPINRTGFADLAATSTALSPDVNIFFNPAASAGAEAITVPAGQTRYFEVKGTPVSSVAGTALTATIKGDTAILVGTMKVNQATTSDVQLRESAFIWSPNSTTSAATTTNDWLNGFTVPGLPSTNMSLNTFTQ